MNVGFSNLITLKTQLLASGLVPSTDFDAPITALGLGVAAAFEAYCNRKFAYTVNDQFICTADRDHAYVARYPIETFTSIELKADITAGWEMQTGLVLNTNSESGLIYWGAGISFQWAQMRITYTGGYWWDTTEDNTGQMPNGATPLPANLKLAWLLQCELTWRVRDKLGLSIVGEEKSQRGSHPQELLDLDISPSVKSMLESFRRYSMI